MNLRIIFYLSGSYSVTALIPFYFYHQIQFGIRRKMFRMKKNKKEDVEVGKRKLFFATNCLMNAHIVRFKMLDYMKCFPLLENVTITYAGKRGRVSLSGGNIADRRNCIRSFYKIYNLWRSDTENNYCNWLRRCYVPLLKLPVSGYVMKGVYLLKCDFVNDDSSMNINLNEFEDKEEAAYSEAVMEIFKKNRERIFGWSGFEDFRNGSCMERKFPECQYSHDIKGESKDW